jgi:D-arabinose 1-dehydrogenase-like Zn-dependent alcohol dehydrogenase
VSEDIPTTMRAFQVVEHGKPLALREVATPEVGPSDVLVRILVSGQH